MSIMTVMTRLWMKILRRNQRRKKASQTLLHHLPGRLLFLLRPFWVTPIPAMMSMRFLMNLRMILAGIPSGDLIYALLEMSELDDSDDESVNQRPTNSLRRRNIIHYVVEDSITSAK
jgi:hypothetical protein